MRWDDWNDNQWWSKESDAWNGRILMYLLGAFTVILLFCGLLNLYEGKQREESAKKSVAESQKKQRLLKAEYQRKKSEEERRFASEGGIELPTEYYPEKRVIEKQ